MKKGKGGGGKGGAPKTERDKLIHALGEPKKKKWKPVWVSAKVKRYRP